MPQKVCICYATTRQSTFSSIHVVEKQADSDRVSLYFRRDARTSVAFFTALALPVVVQLVFLALPANNVESRSLAVFSLTVGGAAIGIAATFLLWSHARRTNQLEIGYIAAFALAFSILLLAQGILTPGISPSSAPGSRAAAFWALPLALIAGVPLLLPKGDLRDSIDGQWRRWVSWSGAFATCFATLLLINPGLARDPLELSSLTPIVVAISMFGAWCLSFRHLQLAVIGRSWTPLLVTLGYGAIASSMLTWIDYQPFSSGFWSAQLLAYSGVYLVSLGSMLAYRKTTHVGSFVEQVVAVDPRSAIGLGLEPLIRRYVRYLNSMEPVARDHVDGTCTLAMTIGGRLGLEGDELRDLGIAGLLHDVGVLTLEDEGLGSHGPWTPQEQLDRQRHVEIGAHLVEASPVLAGAAPIINTHHERMDGRGYPRGLEGQEISVASRILSACDAYDALSRSRQYRTDHNIENALSVIEQSAGTKWDRRVVGTLARYVRSHTSIEMPPHLASDGELGCDCVPAMSQQPLANIL